MTWGPFDLTGKTAIVTGAARGIGLGTARRLREAGANVLLADLDAAGVAAAEHELATQPGSGRVASCAADIAHADAGLSMVQRCVQEFDGIDILVNNAGVYPTATFAEMTPEHIRQLLSVNVEGTILATQAAALQMIDQGRGGAVVNLASMGALRGTHPGMIAYGASKGAVISFTTRAAAALAGHGIRVNAIAPGSIDTEGAADTTASAHEHDEQSAAALAAANAQIPLGRTGTPDDIATVVVFFASDAARYVTGVTMVVDGGRMVA